MTTNYPEIQQKLERIRALDPTFLVFGSDRWKYSFRNVDNYQLDLIELEYDVTLPEDFRAFVTQIGFGAGPSYGASPKRFLTVQRYEVYADEEEEDYKPLDDGYIVVTEHGHGMETVLIVDGPHKGEIWMNDYFGLEKRADSYTEWYTKWVNVIFEILTHESGEAITYITSDF